MNENNESWWVNDKPVEVYQCTAINLIALQMTFTSIATPHQELSEMTNLISKN